MMMTTMVSALMARPTSALHLATSAPAARMPSSPISLGEKYWKLRRKYKER